MIFNFFNVQDLSAIHFLDGEESKGGHHNYSDKELSEFIDNTMGYMDKNNDGFIHFGEYISANMVKH